MRLRVCDTGRRWHYLVCCRRGRWLDEVLATCERDRTALAEDEPASPGNGNHGLALGVVMVLLDVKRRLTPFWTVTDPITPPVTDGLSVLMSGGVPGPRGIVAGQSGVDHCLDAFLLMCLLAQCRC